MRIYYQPNGGISLLPEIRDMGIIAGFGCARIDDYKDGAVLFTTTPNAASILEREVRQFQPDYIFLESFTLEMIDALRRICRFYNGPIVVLNGDSILTNVITAILTRTGKCCNLLLVGDKSDETMLRTCGVPVEFTIQPACGFVYQHTESFRVTYVDRPAIHAV